MIKFSNEVLLLMKTGEMRISKGVPGTTLVEQGVLHSWSFGPTLVLDGQYVETKQHHCQGQSKNRYGYD